MVLQFTPPQDLINAYLSRPSPGQIASEGINKALETYAQSKVAEHKQKNEALQTLLKASDSVDLSDPATAKAFAPLYKDAGVDPSIFQSPVVSTSTAPSPQAAAPLGAPMPDVAGQMQADAAAQQSLPSVTPPDASTPATAPAPISPIIQASLDHPAHKPAFTPEYIDKMSRTGYGRKVIESREKGVKLSEAERSAAAKAEEMGPKSFDYARVYATNAGSPQAAEGFIKLAQAEGRTTLTKRELDDLKNSVSASAQTGRGEFFGGMLGLNRQKFQNQLLQEGNKALNPNVANGALKPQQERLNRIGRADALIQQMKAQAGGGDTRQIRELATSLASILTGGNVVAENQIAELVPQSYKGNINKFYEKLSNNPTGLDQQAFITRLADTIQREKGTIHTQIQGAQQQAIPGLAILRQMNPKGYKGIVEANVNNPAYQDQTQPEGPHGPSVTQNGHVYNWNGTAYE